MKVMLAIASYGGIKCAPLLDSLEQLSKQLNRLDIDQQLEIVEGNCYIQCARNELVYKFLNSDCDRLLFIDDDISFNYDDAIKLIISKLDVVAGVYPKKTDKEDYPVVLYVRPDNTPMTTIDGLLIASHVPTGFLCISKKAIEKLIRAYPEQKYVDFENGEQTREMYDLFPQGIKNGRWWGEDFAFCNLWTAICEQIFVMPDMTLCHHGNNKTYTGNYHDFLMRQPRP